jgi:hypothetical protein
MISPEWSSAERVSRLAQASHRFGGAGVVRQPEVVVAGLDDDGQLVTEVQALSRSTGVQSPRRIG